MNFGADMSLRLAMGTLLRVGLQALFSIWGAKIVISDAAHEAVIIPVAGWLVVFIIQALQSRSKSVVAAAAAVPGTTILTRPEIADAISDVNVISQASVRLVAKQQGQ